MVYKIVITETLQKLVEVDAASIEEAAQMVQDDYETEKIVLDANDFVQVDYDIL